MAPWGFFRSRADFLWRLRISSADRGNLVPVRIFAVEVRLLAAVGISQARAERRRFSAFLKEKFAISGYRGRGFRGMTFYPGT